MKSSSIRQLMPGMDRRGHAGEKIYWSARPRFIPFMVSGLGMVAGFAAILAAFMAFASNFRTAESAAWDYRLWFIGLSLVFMLVAFCRRTIIYMGTSYAYTDHSLLIRSGWRGEQIRRIEFDSVIEMEIVVSIVESGFEAGTIKFFTGRTRIVDGAEVKCYEQWTAIKDPWAIANDLRRLSLHARPDHGYAHALRPVSGSENQPGYSY